MRFEVSRVLDAIEQHLTTDPTLAQAVVDLSDAAHYAELDGGRGVNLVRIGMVVDALGRYLRDGGVYLYPVAPRQLLSDGELTAKERMVLGRWTDEGLVEATPDAAARVPEIAELTGLPILTVHCYDDLAKRHAFLKGAPLRVLTITPRGGGALLTDGTGGTGGVVLRRGEPAAEPDAEPAANKPAAPSRPAIGKATPKTKIDPPPGEAVTATSDGRTGKPAVRPDSVPVWPDPRRVYVMSLPEPPVLRRAPNGMGAAVLSRLWRCDGFDCPSFGDHRRVGQPVPIVRQGVPFCPRHNERLADIGTRPQEVTVALIVDGLRRRRFVVTADRRVVVGRAPDGEAGIAVAQWLHEGAAAWVGPEHLELALQEGQLVVTDLSPNGSLVWMRAEPRSRPRTLRLYEGASHPLGDWDTVELYTGIELGHAERRPHGVSSSANEPASVLVDAPTLVQRLSGIRP